MAYFVPPPAITPPALVQIAQSAASACPTLAPAATRQQLVINLLECLRDPKNSIFFFEDSKRLIKPTSNGDGTIYSFDNAKGQFFITIPNDQEKKISIDADTLIANAIIHAVGDKSIDVTPRDGYRCRCKDLSLTPQQLQTLISNFSSLLKYLKNPSQSSSSLPSQTQEPPIIPLWNVSQGMG
jgi:hypothetical protein